MHNLIDDIRFADFSEMHNALLDYMDKIEIRSAVPNGVCVRGVKIQATLDGGVSSTPTRWLFASGTRLCSTGLPTQGVKVEEKNGTADDNAH
ncbi:hypothetical protein ACNKHV_23550 [Shigella flexneri]